MNILIAGNDNYALGTKVFLKSLCENTKGRDVMIYFMYNKLSLDNQNEIVEILSPYHNVRIKYIFLAIEIFDDMPLTALTNPYITIETYFRMAMSDVLPKSLNKVLYLDTDIIINKPIDELYDLQFNDKTVAYACEDFGIIMAKKIRKKVFCNLKFNKSDKYFNAGVLLLNLSYIRVHYSFETFKNYICKNHDRLLFHDQDVLNAIFRNHVQYVDFNRYDCRPFFYPYSTSYERFINEQAVIIHYGEKPWDESFTDLAGSIFWHYACLAGYTKEYELWKTKNENYIRCNSNSIFWNRLKRNIKSKTIVKG